jgi:hypothetical protein
MGKIGNKIYHKIQNDLYNFWSNLDEFWSKRAFKRNSETKILEKKNEKFSMRVYHLMHGPIKSGAHISESCLYDSH